MFKISDRAALKELRKLIDLKVIKAKGRGEACIMYSHDLRQRGSGLGSKHLGTHSTILRNVLNINIT